MPKPAREESTGDPGAPGGTATMANGGGAAPPSPEAPRLPLAAAENTPNPLLGALSAAKPVQLSAARREAPVFAKTVVIYLGTEHNHSVSLRGQLAIETVQEFDPTAPDGIRVVERRSVPDEGGEGCTCYDFSTHDLVGRLIRQRIVPMGHATLGQFAGKPVAFVEHPDHLFHFHRAGGGQQYLVVCPPEQLPALNHYFQQRVLGVRAKEEEILSTIQNATASAA